MRKILVNLVVGLVVVVSVSGGTELYVAQNGQTPGAPYATWASAASNIQAAVDAAAIGDTIGVGPGRYYAPAGAPAVEGNVNVLHLDKPLTIRSSAGAAQTFIDGQNQNRSVLFRYHSSSTNRFMLDGFTVANSHDNGIMFVANANIAWTGLVHNCTVTDTLFGRGVDGFGFQPAIPDGFNGNRRAGLPARLRRLRRRWPC